MSSLIAAYNKKLVAGECHPDDDQMRAIGFLDQLGDFLLSPEQLKRKKFLERLARKTSASEVKGGIYLYGGVGRGKTMVMDLFFKSLPIAEKRRVHFHAFMLEVHDYLHRRRQARSDAREKNPIDDDLMAYVRDVAAKTRLLCFDEFFVKDVADAMILGRLFTALLDQGVTVVMTSNVAPDDLYKDGLQRERFLPFIQLLKQRLEIVPFTGATDYRLRRIRHLKAYYWPSDDDARRDMQKIFETFADGAMPAPLDIIIKERKLHVPKAVREAAWFSFSDLCESNKSAVDYLALASRFRAFFIEGVPVMGDQKRDAALRFITLIDTLYDHRVRLIMSAAAAPDRLYTGDDHASIFSRTASRLYEMQSKDYVSSIE